MKSARARIASQGALRAVWKTRRSRLIKSCFGVDRIAGPQFQNNIDAHLVQIERRILSTDFRPDGLLAIAKPKGNGADRIICVPTIADRMIQFSMLEVLRPQFARMGVDNLISYGIAEGRERSVFGAREFACRERGRRPWVYKTDIQKFFDRIPREELRKAIERRIRQPSLVPLLRSFMSAEITDGLDRDWRQKIAAAGIVQGLGVRQGMPLSPLLAGVFMIDLDRWLLKLGSPVARYVDDLIAFFPSEKACIDFDIALRDRLARSGLSIDELGSEGSKTRIYSPSEPAEFLGMEITPPVDSRCKLIVPTKVIVKIIKRFEEVASSTELLKQRVHLTSMDTFFLALVDGYSNSYLAADNFKDFNNSIQEAALAARDTVVLEIFGGHIDQLSERQQEFVGFALGSLLPRNPLRSRR